jgi:hypothetical protein
MASKGFPCWQRSGPADLYSANLTGTTADEDTIWPEGFDPEAAGVIFE